MTTKELIAQLQKEDPTGTAEVVVNGDPIEWLERLPGYYDGAYGQLLQGELGSTVGYRLRRDGHKLVLRPLELEDLLWSNVEARVELHESLGAWRITDWQERVEKLRQKIREEYVKT